jgi:hypothetical protein
MGFWDAVFVILLIINLEQMKGQMATAIKVAETPIKRCPKCGSEKLWRIQRSVAEKIIYFASERKYAARKYVCKACSATYLLHRDGKRAEDISTMRLEQDSQALLSCSGCGEENVTLSKISIKEMKLLKDETGKTAFRKLICSDCGLELTIFREDYNDANRNEI